ncbi:MAG: stage III sporulation protein AA [Bacillota bacterium]
MGGDSRKETAAEEIMAFFPDTIRRTLSRIPGVAWEKVEEIRLRIGQPLNIRLCRGDVFVSENGDLLPSVTGSYRVTADDVYRTTQLVTRSSLYSVEDELRNGFVTVSGGHRVGIAGKVLLDDKKIRTIKHVWALNFRVSREVAGVADRVLPYLVERDRVKHTLIVSPPRCGKTTLLRDVVRQISCGIPALGFRGVTVGLVDERSEIAGCYKGVPQRDVGPRTDVLDACPKAEGMMLLLRAFSPEVIATDEIGRSEDIAALEEALNTGVTIIATVHARTIEELERRPALRYMTGLRIIERFILLGNDNGPGTVREIINGRTMKALGGVTVNAEAFREPDGHSGNGRLRDHGRPALCQASQGTEGPGDRPGRARDRDFLRGDSPGGGL